VKSTQDMISRATQRSSATSHDGEDKAPDLLQTQLYEFVEARHADYMKRMTELLGLYAQCRWGSKGADGDQEQLILLNGTSSRWCTKTAGG
jgi:hypothetical protein